MQSCLQRLNLKSHKNHSVSETTTMKRIVATFAVLALFLSPALAAESRVVFDDDPAEGEMRIVVDGEEALVYQYGDDQDMVHYYPVRSPEGQPMTVQKIEPFPHHRSFWFADKVQLKGAARAVGFYSALYSGSSRGADSKPPYKDHIRHLEFIEGEATKDEATLTAKLVWEMDGDKPVFDETRVMRVVALGEGQWLLDVTFTLTATHGDVEFVSDAVHYAWPYLRMNKEFSVAGGGTITNSEGGVNQAGTNGKTAKWVDYSSTVEGSTSGMAVFPHPSMGPESPNWLTRDYGTFGPRRAAEQSGKRFTVAKGDTISQRVGILVHRGDVEQAEVAQQYAAYVAGEL